MAMTIHCDIVSAEAQIYSGLVELLVATGPRASWEFVMVIALLLTALVPAGATGRAGW